jgi:leucine-rich repeat protein SHOC2
LHKFNITTYEFYKKNLFLVWKTVKLPPGILINLINLNICSSDLYSIPSEIGLLKNLGGIKFAILGNLINLKRLFAFYNKLKFIPTDIRLLKNLRNIFIHHNLLEVLPTEIGNLNNLEQLVINNDLIIILTEVGLLKNLYFFDMDHNKLKTLPSELALLDKLNKMSIRWNKIDNMPVKLENGKYFNIIKS